MDRPLHPLESILGSSQGTVTPRRRFPRRNTPDAGARGAGVRVHPRKRNPCRKARATAGHASLPFARTCGIMPRYRLDWHKLNVGDCE